jgi:hypothetical protein
MALDFGDVLKENILSMKTFWIVVVALAAVACQPEPDNLKLYDELVVSTNFDPQAQFGSYATFAMATDTIGFASNQTADTILTHTDSDLVRPIISKVRANLEQRGYTQVSREEDPDLGVNIMIVNNLNFFQQVVDPGYYNYYYGYSSYYYYPYVETYVENTGTLVLQIVDLKNRNANNQVKVVWTAYLGDLIKTVNRLEQTEKGIDQSFIQSPYIQQSN